MLDCSRYAFHVRDWQARFGAANVLVLLNDDLAADPQNYLDCTAGFIGIPRINPSSPATGRRTDTIETAPRSAWLANKARKFRFWLGSHQFYGARRFLDRVGAWRLCFEGGQKFLPLDTAVEAWLRDQLKPEVEALGQLLRRDLCQWKEVRQQTRSA